MPAFFTFVCQECGRVQERHRNAKRCWACRGPLRRLIGRGELLVAYDGKSQWIDEMVTRGLQSVGLDLIERRYDTIQDRRVLAFREHASEAKVQP